MKKSGSTNQITDFSLLTIGVFLTLLFAFVGYRCCRRKRSSGKKKHLQRDIRKAFSKKSQKSSQLLKETSLNTLEKELNDQSEDKKIISSSTRNTKKSPVSSTPKSADKYRNTEEENKKANVPKFLSILSRIWRREEDIERGQHPLPDSPRETVPITSTMDKKKDTGNRNARTQSSNSYKETSREKKSQSKKQKGNDVELSEIKHPVSLISPTLRQSANLLLSKDASQEKKRNKRSSSNQPCGCTGSDCKKCKPHRESIDSNKTPVVTEKESIPYQEKSSKKLIYNSDAMEVESRTSKSDTTSSTSPSNDFSMVDVEEKEHGDSSTDAPASHVSSAHCSVTCSQDVYVIIGKTKENTTDKTTEKTTESVLASQNKQDFEMIEELPCKKLIKKTDPQPMEDSTTLYHDGPMDNKEGATGNVHHGKRLESVGNVYDVIEYASREWKGHTTKAEAIRKGYSEVRKQLGLHTLRVVRGDNYCAIRATLFQALAKKISILGKFKEIHAIPRQLLSEGFDWIRYWNFGARFHVEKSEVCKKMEECLKDLYDLVNLSSKMENKEGRVSHLLSSLNYKHEDYELRLMEAVKFLMLASAIELHKSMSQGSDVPVFAMIMFARDTSLNPCEFMKRHLNAVGDTGGLEQVEMYLLGYTLGITIEVVRPSHFGKPDFIASYPDEMPVHTPRVTLVAEDDRHYNILS